MAWRIRTLYASSIAVQMANIKAFWTMNHLLSSQTRFCRCLQMSGYRRLSVFKIVKKYFHWYIQCEPTSVLHLVVTEMVVILALSTSWDLQLQFDMHFTEKVNSTYWPCLTLLHRPTWLFHGQFLLMTFKWHRKYSGKFTSKIIF